MPGKNYPITRQPIVLVREEFMNRLSNHQIDTLSYVKPLGGGIMPDGVPLASQFFVQLRQIAMSLTKTGRPLKCLLVSGDGAGFILLIFEDHSQVEMGEDQFRPMLKGTAVAGFRLRQITGVMI